MIRVLSLLIPSLFIFAAVRLSVFLYFDVIAFCKRFGYSSLLRRYIFDVLSAAVKVLFHDCIPFRFLASLVWNLLSTFRNLRFFTSFIKSSSNGTNSFTCDGHLLISVFHKQYGFASYLFNKIFYFLY